jgi:hypothetical protein
VATPPTGSSPDRTLAYATAVVSGEIVAGPHVRNACKRHIADLARKDGIWFDHDAANHAFAFFEEVLKLSEGQFEGEPFRLEPSQAFIVGSAGSARMAAGGSAGPTSNRAKETESRRLLAASAFTA